MRKSIMVITALGLLMVSSCTQTPAPTESSQSALNKRGGTTKKKKSPTPLQQDVKSLGADCQKIVDEMSRLTEDLRIPDHLLRDESKVTGEEFDVSKYFEILTHISPEPRYVLDFVYWHEPMGSRPVVYARKEEAPPHETYGELDNALDDPFGSHMQHIEVNDTALGFFEWVVLRTYGEQFYLTGHAVSSLDWTIICNRNAAQEVIADASDFGKPLTVKQKRGALNLDFEPQVEMGKETVQVRTIVFSKWGGFYKHTETISREFPHRLLEADNVRLVPYNCGVMP